MKSLDKKIVYQLMMNARSTWSQLANELGMSGPAISERVHRLEQKGIIKGYSAIINPELAGYEMTAFITLSISKQVHREGFLTHIKNLSEVQECHHIAGGEDYMLKVRCKDTKDLDRMITQELRELPGINNTKSMIVLNSHKDTPIIPMSIED